MKPDKNQIENKRRKEEAKKMEEIMKEYEKMSKEVERTPTKNDGRITPTTRKKYMSAHKMRRSPKFTYLHEDPTMRLHAEIMDFFEEHRPNKSQDEKRKEACERIKRVIQKRWRECEVVVYGSYPSGTYLPDSDIDITIFLESELPERELVYQLGNHLNQHAEKGRLKIIQTLPFARVPIIKLLDLKSLFQIDISFNVSTCHRSVTFTRYLINIYPPLLPLLLVTKRFLQVHSLNEPFHGGLSSFSLLLLIVSFLQFHVGYNQSPKTVNLGSLLIDFFGVYACFNFRVYGISILNGGYYFYKPTSIFYSQSQPEIPVIVDPLAQACNATRSTYAIRTMYLSF
ncbi:inactive non-canonical poly(a) RNA polymerase protein trf4-2-related [Anaeramoeba ignava]|uniref:Inactive non-canonical poly(A) RNA polymerase protein trf4-2-related n=1 Tax=Anaeramoeba ignava TaxID=1746090 RepID=A0A9Q0R4J8_ANAIG|nr:inactive non-canonical poly(a) RNA polymerase protein trf4-2-related [Anaeramoeba ignava]